MKGKDHHEKSPHHASSNVSPQALFPDLGESQTIQVVPEPVERRTLPRAPVSGINAELISGGLFSGEVYEVLNISEESIFIQGKRPSRCLPGRRYRVRLNGPKQAIEFSAICTRTELANKAGAAMRLMDYEKEGKDMLLRILHQPKFGHIGRSFFFK